jgi:hypothetical protein
MMNAIPVTRTAIAAEVDKALRAQRIVDMHTHLYPPTFGTPVANRTGKTDAAGLMLWGLDELLTYHYLVAEVYRVVPATVLPYEKFWKMSKAEQADHIWKHLFVERTPLSEACRGVLTSLQMLGLDVGRTRDLAKARKWFAQQDPDRHIDRVMQAANVENITMTNPVFDDNERERWLKSPEKLRGDSRFRAVLRIDPILMNWPEAAKKLAKWGHAAGDGTTLTRANAEEGRRFLREWIERQGAIYVALSLPPEWRYPSEAGSRKPEARKGDAMRAGQLALEKIILPVLAEKGMAFAMMIGSRRGVNPGLRDGGDMSGLADVSSVARLCAAFPQNRFFVTILARENQHELCVTARKFGNLMPFGCWWFLNNPSLIDEITRMRMELLGSSMIPQHSDSRVLEQLLYKWKHSRAVIGKVLVDKYADVAATGWRLTRADIQADVERLLKGNFSGFLGRR